MSVGGHSQGPRAGCPRPRRGARPQAGCPRASGGVPEASGGVPESLGRVPQAGVPDTRVVFEAYRA